MPRHPCARRSRLNGSPRASPGELDVQVWLHLSGDEVPDSEPIYRRGGTRRFSMTVTNDQKEEPMSTTDPYTHMEEAWKLDGNPFPPRASGGLARTSRSRPTSSPTRPRTSSASSSAARSRGQRSVGFLWSRGPGGDTGYGKTTLMEAAAREINVDLGETVLLESGMKPRAADADRGRLHEPQQPRRCRALPGPLPGRDRRGDARRRRRSGRSSTSSGIGSSTPSATTRTRSRAPSARRTCASRPAGRRLRPELVNAFVSGRRRRTCTSSWRGLAGVAASQRPPVPRLPDGGSGRGGS